MKFALDRLKQIVARVLGRRPPPSGPLPDPHAGVREPRNRRPNGRESAVGVMEPEPERLTHAVGRAYSATDPRGQRG